MSEKAKKYNDLKVWEKSHNLVLEIHRITKDFPKEEVYGLTSQIRRASVSIPANIAEGFARSGIRDKIRFYNIAAGSLNELSYFLLLAKDLNYADTSKLQEITEEIAKMLSGYVKALQKTTSNF